MGEPGSPAVRAGTEPASRAATRGAGPGGSGGELFALGALLFLLSTTLVWWSVALWPAADTLPGWLQTARAVCFGTHSDGLPNAGGWILLVGEPVGMVVALFLVWGEPLSRGLRLLAGGTAGRLALGLGGLAVLTAAGLAFARVADARTHPGAIPAQGGSLPRRLSGAAPPLGLVDQHGRVLTLERFRGRPLLVTFAFAHCETVCPLLVHDALRARAAAGAAAPALVVVTVDPWRDTPARLPSIAERWRLDERAHVLSGDVGAVQRVLEAWGVGAVRDARTGEIAHVPVSFLVDASGELAYVSTGPIAELLQAPGAR